MMETAPSASAESTAHVVHAAEIHVLVGRVEPAGAAGLVVFAHWGVFGEGAEWIREWGCVGYHVSSVGFAGFVEGFELSFCGC